MFHRITRDRYLSDPELAAFMAAVRERRHRNQPRDYAFFSLLANTGIRPSEALVLTRADVRLGGGEPWIRVRRLKKRRPHPQIDELLLTTGLTEALASHLSGLDNDPATLLFPVCRRSVQRLYKHYARAAGITRNTHLYILRHTAATRIYRTTRNIYAVQALLGHEHANTSSLYAHIPRDLLAQAVAGFPVVI